MYTTTINLVKESIVRSKVVFLLLFMLSFTVMHDTVITLLDNDENVLVSHYVSVDKQASDVAYVHDLHGMFHFMAVVTPLMPVLEMLKSEQTLCVYSLQYILPHLESSTKPPIA